MERPLASEIARFSAVGIATVLVDLAVYSVAALGLSGPVPLAKAAGFIAGTVFAFFANRSVTFRASGPLLSHVMRFVALYSVTLSLNVSANSALLWLLRDRAGGAVVAFLVATGVSAAANFAGMKGFVFVHRGGV